MRLGPLEIPAAIGGQLGRLGSTAQNALEVARFGGLETDEEATPYEVVARAAGLPAAPLPDPEAEAGDGPPVLLVPPLMLAAEVYDVSPAASAVAHPARARRRPLGGRLRRSRARGGRAGAEPRRPRRRGRRRDRAGPRGERPRRPPRRLLAGRDVLLPGRRVPAQRGHRERHHLRQPGRPAGRDAARPSRSAGRRRRRVHRRSRPRRALGPRLGDPHRLRAARPGQVAAPADRVRPAAPRPRGAAAPRAPAAVPDGRGLGRLAGSGAGRLHRAVPRPQPDARRAAS